MTEITLSPIGFFKTDFSIETGAPRQGILAPDSKGIIDLKMEYIEGLYRLKDFEYIWVMFHFHQKEGWSNRVIPPGSHHEFGVFASRSPRRPNPVSLSLVKLEKIEGNIIHVKGVDAFNGTPVLDIKPYLPSIDIISSPVNEKAEYQLSHHDDDYIYKENIPYYVKGEEHGN